MPALEAKEAKRLLRAFRDEEIEAAVIVALGTGLRRGELLALQWSDIDLDAGALTIHRALEWIDGSARFKEPKTKRSRRTIQIAAFALERLRRHRIE